MLSIRPIFFYDPAKITTCVRRYIDVLKQRQVPIERVFIFGSAARGTQNKGKLFGISTAGVE